MADIDFDTMTRAELTELRGQLDKAITAAGDRDRRAALAAAESAVRQHGFSLADLMSQIAGGELEFRGLIKLPRNCLSSRRGDARAHPR